MHNKKIVENSFKLFANQYLNNATLHRTQDAESVREKGSLKAINSICENPNFNPMLVLHAVTEWCSHKAHSI